jgi:hypothetical protein
MKLLIREERHEFVKIEQAKRKRGDQKLCVRLFIDSFSHVCSTYRHTEHRAQETFIYFQPFVQWL